jgi:hypothetical protein
VLVTKCRKGGASLNMCKWGFCDLFEVLMIMKCREDGAWKCDCDRRIRQGACTGRPLLSI